MTDPKSILLPAVATPALQVILNLIGLLKLPVLAHWAWNPTTELVVPYITSTACAAIAGLLTPRSNRRKAIAVGLGLAILVVSLWLYTWISTNPPPAGRLALYDTVGYISFFTTYGAFGYTVANVVAFFTRRPNRTS